MNDLKKRLAQCDENEANLYLCERLQNVGKVESISVLQHGYPSHMKIFLVTMAGLQEAIRAVNELGPGAEPFGDKSFFINVPLQQDH